MSRRIARPHWQAFVPDQLIASGVFTSQSLAAPDEPPSQLALLIAGEFKNPLPIHRSPHGPAAAYRRASGMA